VDLSIRTVAKVQHLRGKVARQKEVFAMMADEAGALSLQNVLIRALAMDVVHQNRVLIFGGPRAALVDHRAGVCMTAARVARPPIAQVGTRADVMPMVGNRLNVGVSIRIEMLAGLPLV